nr:pseudouridine synthase [Stenotrophomonas indicatrix]
MTTPSRLQLPPGDWVSLLEGLCARFPRIDRLQWESRFARGRIQDAQGRALAPDMPWQVGLEIRYFREVADEPVIPFVESILHHDAHLLVADKPHFLPTAPAGAFVRQTLLARLVERTGNVDLVPLHRLDRLTAGLVLFSTQPQTRDAYQRLFRERRIEKTYEALAPALPELRFPLERHSRLQPGEPFFRMAEVPGEPNARTARSGATGLRPNPAASISCASIWPRSGRRSWGMSSIRSCRSACRVGAGSPCNCWRRRWPSTIP